MGACRPGGINLGKQFENIRDLANRRNDEKQRAGAQASQPTYAEAPSYMDTARDMLPKTDIGSMPEYAAATSKVDISQLPQYQSAAQKTAIDPRYYQNKWQESSDDITEAYGKKGGYYDRMLGNLNERGLANSGEYNFQTREMGQNLATELAQARQGIETEAMGQQAQFDESYANRMGGLLGTQAGYDQNQISNMGNLLGTRAGYDWAGSQGQAGLAGQLAGARNTLISGDYDRAAQAAQAESQQQSDILAQLFNIGGSADVIDEYENIIAQLMGYPMPEQESQPAYNPFPGGSFNPFAPQSPATYNPFQNKALSLQKLLAEATASPKMLSSFYQ